MGASDLRKNVLDLLWLIASREKQLAYDREERIADPATELGCMWFDDLYKPDWSLFKEAFTPAEQDTLAAFDRCDRAQSKQLPDTLAAMQQSFVWHDRGARRFSGGGVTRIDGDDVGTDEGAVGTVAWTGGMSCTKHPRSSKAPASA